MRVLFAGPPSAATEALKRELERPGWIIDIHTEGPVQLAAREHRYETIVLQSEDPDEAASQCKSIRDDDNWVPIILCCGGDRSTEVAVRGLDAGADAFVVEPSSVELSALARAVTRRKSEPRPAVLVMGDLELDPASRTVTRGGRRVALTTREFSLLEFLMRNAGTALGRAAILDAVWGFDYNGASNVVDVYVGYLRRKLGNPDGTDFIRSVRGIGYAIDAPVKLVNSEVVTQIDLRGTDQSDQLGA